MVDCIERWDSPNEPIVPPGLRSAASCLATVWMSHSIELKINSYSPFETAADRQRPRAMLVTIPAVPPKLILLGLIISD
jgi:hypothetical protein